MLELDVRTVPPRERPALLFAGFDGLEPGAALLLVNDREPLALLEVLQQERAGAYEWSWLEDGPKLWRVRVARRPALRTGVHSISDLLGADHDRLDLLFLSARQAWATAEVRTAARHFAAFAVGLRRHIGAEDAVLFPAFEQSTGHSPATGPTAVMREEHREIEGLLEAIAASLTAGATSECREMGQLAALLLAHNRKEEHVLYPMSDRSMEPAARSRLCRQLEAT